MAWPTAFWSPVNAKAASLTWGCLDRRIRTRRGAAPEVPRGARVLLLFPPGLDFVPAFFASMAAGTSPSRRIPGGHRSDRLVTRLRGMIADAGISLVVAPSAVHARRSIVESVIPELRGIAWINVDDVDDGPGRSAFGSRDRRLTSCCCNTRPDPRPIHAASWSRTATCFTTSKPARACRARSPIDRVSWLPVNHDMGLIDGVLQPAFSGFPVSLMAPASFLQRLGALAASDLA